MDDCCGGVVLVEISDGTRNAAVVTGVLFTISGVLHSVAWPAVRDRYFPPKPAVVFSRNVEFERTQKGAILAISVDKNRPCAPLRSYLAAHRFDGSDTSIAVPWDTPLPVKKGIYTKYYFFVEPDVDVSKPMELYVEHGNCTDGDNPLKPVVVPVDVKAKR